MQDKQKAYSFALSNIWFSWKAYFIYSIPSLLSVFTRLDLEKVELLTLFHTFLAGLILTYGLAPLLWLGFRALNKTRLNRTFHPFAPLLVIITFGTIRGVLLESLIRAFEIQDNLSVLSSILRSIFFTLLFFTTASFIVELFSLPAANFQKEFSSATLERLRTNTPGGNTLSEVEYLHSMKLIRKAIERHLPADQSIEPDHVSILTAAREIQLQIQEVLRPLSHRLWIGTFGEIESVRIGKSILESIRNPRFSMQLLLLSQFFVGLFGITLTLGLTDSLIQSLAGTATSAFIIIVFRKLQKNNHNKSLILGITFLICLGIFPVLIGLITITDLDQTSRFIAGSAIIPVLPVTVIIASLYKSIHEDKEFAIIAARSVRLQQTVSASTSEKKTLDLELAGYIHNNLQSELVRISKNLEKSASTQMSQDYSAQISNLYLALNRSIEDIALLRVAGLNRLNLIVKSWEGIADIRLSIPEKFNLSVEKTTVLVELIEEMITNSIRHGEASIISISISQNEDESKVVLSHDGRAIILEGTGLGTWWIAQNSAESPQLNSDATSVTYTLSI